MDRGPPRRRERFRAQMARPVGPAKAPMGLIIGIVVVLLIVIIVVVVLMTRGNGNNNNGGGGGACRVNTTYDYTTTTSPILSGNGWGGAAAKLIETSDAVALSNNCTSAPEALAGFTVDSNTSKVYGRLNLPGLDHGTHRYLGQFETAAGCSAVCANDPTCVGFSFHKGLPGSWEGTCYTVGPSDPVTTGQAYIDTYTKI